MKILAVIPARGGSKGIFKKNLQKINNFSLVSIAVKNALNSNCFTKVHVSTDCEEIRKNALEHNADCSYLRPDYLSDDKSKTKDALEYCLKKEKELGYEYDAICELQPTYIFRGETIIKDAIFTFTKFYEKFNSLLTISSIKNTSHPDYACKLDVNNQLIYGSSDPNSFSRHEITDYFSFHGIVFISKVEFFIRNKSLFNKPTYGFKINDIKRQWDINDLDDLEIARIIANKYPDILFS